MYACFSKRTEQTLCPLCNLRVLCAPLRKSNNSYYEKVRDHQTILLNDLINAATVSFNRSLTGMALKR
jgi:hypothetical protein